MYEHSLELTVIAAFGILLGSWFLNDYARSAALNLRRGSINQAVDDLWVALICSAAQVSGMMTLLGLHLLTLNQNIAFWSNMWCVTGFLAAVVLMVALAAGIHYRRSQPVSPKASPAKGNWILTIE